jgi:hypothetical protein
LISSQKQSLAAATELWLIVDISTQRKSLQKSAKQRVAVWGSLSPVHISHILWILPCSFAPWCHCNCFCNLIALFRKKISKLAGVWDSRFESTSSIYARDICGLSNPNV